MKKLLLLTVCVLSLCGISVAGDLGTTTNGEIIQGCNFDGTESMALTVNSTTRDNTLYGCFSIYSPIDCRLRLMATSSKTGSLSDVIIGGQFQTIVTNKKTPFANASGCTGGVWRRNTAATPK